ncbi:MAG TPA: DivIVA domain-containing protein [Mycobacteriales bacterium]|nr:DivIVA domain-containing protein [Mycobacteriales bacterium]
MPLTPTDVANKQFTLSRLRPGYLVDEVDAFLDEVESELARLFRENNELRNRAAPAPPSAPSAAPEPAAPPEPQQAAAPAAPLGPMEGQEAALRTLLLAQRTADEAVAEARAEAAQMVQAAQSEAEQLLSSARAEAEQTLGSARGEAEQLRASSRAEADSTLVRARAEAERTVATARDSALQLEQQAAAKVQAATGDLEERQRSLESRIEELRAFEREYRTRLRAYLENQLRELVSRTGPDDDGGAGVPAAARSSAVGLPSGGPADAPPRESPAPQSGFGAGPTAAAEAVGPFGSEPPTVDGAGSR